MNTKEAIQAMIDGKKCKKTFWKDDCYCRFDENRFIDELGRVLYSFGESDWEIYEQQKLVPTITIEKWLCIEDGENYCTYEGDTNYFNAIENFEKKKVKLLETYEVTL